MWIIIVIIGCIFIISNKYDNLYHSFCSFSSSSSYCPSLYYSPSYHTFFCWPIYIIPAQHIPPHLFSSSWSFAVLRVLDVGMLIVLYLRNIPINDRRAVSCMSYQTMFIYLLFYLLHGGSRKIFLEIRRSSPMAMLDRESPRILRRSAGK